MFTMQSLITLLAIIVATGATGVSSVRQINQAGIDLIKQQEGFRANYYYDQIGQKTIGYGHACAFDPQHCSQLQPPLSEAQATDLMLKDLVQFEQCVDTAAPGLLNDNQFAACTSFAFNMGCLGFTRSTVLQAILQRNYQQAADNFNQYTSMAGQVIPGLVNRRRAESALFGS